MMDIGGKIMLGERESSKIMERFIQAVSKMINWLEGTISPLIRGSCMKVNFEIINLMDRGNSKDVGFTSTWVNLSTV
jgi:hypothetical protein